jgi:hypothetical protein
MSDQTPTQTGDLGEMPAAETEPAELNPGGVDALPEEDEVVPADLGPDTNPAVEETPDPLKRVLEEGEDTETEETEADEHESGKSTGSEGEKESPA